MHIHKWEKWEVKDVTMYVTEFGSHIKSPVETFIAKRQTRECTKCGITQMKGLSK